MKLLIVTQKVDAEDPILGFFHRWLLEFSKHSELTVIGQSVGVHHLPHTVRVRSLGKEKGKSRIIQIILFWWFCFSERRNYDAVLVHMTPVWVVLGAKTWFLLRKRVYLWYEVRRGGILLRLAVLLSRKVFSATQHGLPWHSAKQVVTGHGIDTEFFRPSEQPRDPFLLLAIGRLTPIKKVELFLQALAKLPSHYRLHIIGGTITESDKIYVRSLATQMAELGITDRVSYGFGTQAEVARELQRAVIVLHAAGGGLDKAILEAMSSGCPVLSASVSSEDILPSACVTTPSLFVGRLLDCISSHELETPKIAKQLRTTIETHHSLPKLIERLVYEMSA
jgi:glycosyltransferase involved in cell wall biosynthesis